VGRIADVAPWVLVAAELRPSYTGRDEIRVTSIYQVRPRILDNRVAKGELLTFDSATPQEPE